MEKTNNTGKVSRDFASKQAVARGDFGSGRVSRKRPRFTTAKAILVNESGFNREACVRLPKTAASSESLQRVREGAVSSEITACGLIAGRFDGEVKVVEKVYFLTNVDRSNEHFSLDPKEQLAAVKDMRANEFAPLGNWHSHPESPSRPSDEDKRLSQSISKGKTRHKCV